MGRADHYFKAGLPAAFLAAGAFLTTSCSASDDGSADVDHSVANAVPPIVFASEQAGKYDLWLMDPDGGRQTRLTTSGGNESTPEWSPDGTRVAFAASPQGGPADLYVIDAEGDNLRQLTDSGACEDTPTWSPDGHRIVAVSQTDCDDELTASLVVLASDGSGEPRQIVDAPALWPDWSPDGRHLVYTGPTSAGDDTALWVSAPDGSRAHPLHLPGINSPTEPSWAPDSHRIAFVSPTGTYAHENPVLWNEDVYITDANAKNVERVTTTAGNDHWPPAWSPDGSTLVYSSDGIEAKQGDLMSIHLDTRNVTRLTDTATNQLLADWRP